MSDLNAVSPRETTCRVIRPNHNVLSANASQNCRLGAGRLLFRFGGAGSETRRPPVLTVTDVRCYAGVVERRKLGNLEVSVVGLGCNNFGSRIDEQTTMKTVGTALDCGITFFDTSDTYGRTRSEEFLGKALRQRRREVVIATKFGAPIDDERPGGANPAYVRTACEDSLRRLDTDVIDLYQLHLPDPNTPIADTLAALNDLVTAGKVREIGCSHFSATQLREAHQALADGAARFVSVQNHYNLLHRDDEAEVLPLTVSLGMSYIPYFPLANGLLTGKYRRGQPAPEGTRLSKTYPWLPPMLTDANFDVVERLTKWAEPRGRQLLDLAFAWLAAKPGVASVIAGAVLALSGDRQRRGRAMAYHQRRGRRDRRSGLRHAQFSGIGPGCPGPSRSRRVRTFVSPEVAKHGRALFELSFQTRMTRSSSSWM